MKSRAKALVIATGIGIFVLIASYGAAFYAYQTGLEGTARVLSWPNTVLQIPIPCIPIGEPEKGMCEGSPLNVLAYVASFPLAVIVYSAAAYSLLRRRSAIT